MEFRVVRVTTTECTILNSSFIQKSGVKMNRTGGRVMKVAGGHQRLHVCKDKQPFSTGADLLLREDAEEFCQETIPKGIDRPARC